MSDPTDPELEQALRDHYREAGGVTPPSALAARVRVDLAGRGPRRRAFSLATLPLAAAVVVALVALLSLSPLAGGPTATDSHGGPARPSSPGASPPASPGPLDADGIPTSAGGERVLRGGAIDDWIATANDSTPVLVGGLVTRYAYPCPFPLSTPVSVLLPPCADTVKVDGRRIVDLPGLVAFGDADVPMVLRVHVHDERAAACPPADRLDCERAIVVERIEWRGGAPPTAAPSAVGLDGIPSSIGGEPVLRGAAIDERIASTATDDPFLAAGWTRFVQADCAVPSDFPATPLLAPCGDGFQLVDAPPSASGSAWASRLVLDGQAVIAEGGPLVLRVHAHDARAAACPAAYRQRCEAAIVVEAVVWGVGPQR